MPGFPSAFSRGIRLWSLLSVAAMLIAACGSNKSSVFDPTPVGGGMDSGIGSGPMTSDASPGMMPGTFGHDGGDGGGGPCMPKTCAQLKYNCGPNLDGCGNSINCGTCTAPEYCGGGGMFSVCGGNSAVLDGGTLCVPKTCGQLGLNCGPGGDGCGNVLNCGTCSAPQTCGGAGTPGLCGDSAPCTGLCLNQVTCPMGGTTSISGTVVAGTQGVYLGLSGPDPVPNVIVYVPNGPVQPFTAGVQCSQCGADVTGNPLIQTTTDFTGAFTLNNVPVPPSGDVPIVIQLGRWRRQNLTFHVTACANTNVGAIHMPRNKSEGDIPLTAISTGNYDAMECVLLKMGVDQAEFTAPTASGGTGRMQMYFGNGVNATLPPETTLTDTPATLADYDQVLFPCWGEDPDPTDTLNYDAANVKTPTEQTNVINYTISGGRMFATHFSYSWMYDVQPFQSTATWVPDAEYDSSSAVIQQSPAEVDVFYQWMNNLGIFDSGSIAGLFSVNQPRNNFVNPSSQTELWVAGIGASGGPNGAPTNFPLLYTFNTPLGATSQCGRVIYSDFHVTVVPTASGTTAGLNFPAECTPQPMSAQEKALEYIIWDLASCVPPPPTPLACTPLTCAGQGVSCGAAGDGCGNLLQCGVCVAPQTCGGGGQNGVCGYINGGSCTPETCASQGISCGPAGDGCGNTLDCGPCTAPQTCGGGGMVGKCGGGAAQ